MLIGQAPGWREIETGLPFAWDAGKRLCGWLAAAGIGVDDFRERWYATSVGKCYPAGQPGSSVDRPPSRAEIARWAPILREELRLVAPRARPARRRLGPSLRVRAGARASTTSSGASWPGMRRRAHRSWRCRIRPGASTWLNDPARVELWRRGIALLRATGGRSWRREPRSCGSASRCIVALGAFVSSCSWWARSASRGPRSTRSPSRRRSATGRTERGERGAPCLGLVRRARRGLRRRRRRRRSDRRLAPARLPAARPAARAAVARRDPGGAAPRRAAARRAARAAVPVARRAGRAEPARAAARVRRSLRRSGTPRPACRSGRTAAGTPSS